MRKSFRRKSKLTRALETYASYKSLRAVAGMGKFGLLGVVGMGAYRLWQSRKNANAAAVPA